MEFLPGTDIKDAVEEMHRIHCETKGQVETVFNGIRIIIANNDMFEKFGLRKDKSKGD